MKTYNILARIDLSNYYTKGKSWLYNTINSLHKTEYEDKDRIVFYFNSNDYEQVQEIKEFLEFALTSIDIPKYFVITEFSDNLTHKKYDDTKCVYPWISVHVTPQNGSIIPCCIASASIDNIKDYPTIQEAINCNLLKETRLAMLKGEKPRTCKVCYDLESQNLLSLRKTMNANWNNVSYQTKNDGSIDLDLRYYDIRLNNLCNFKCRTCSGEFSSSIASEEQEIYNIENTSIKSTHKDTYFTFYNSVLENLDKVEEFYFAGGEPLIMKEHYQILDKLILQKKLDVKLQYSTNVSQLTYKTKNVIEYWKQFYNIELALSLDAMGKQAEYLRKGTKWSQILKNIQTIKNNCPHIKLRITSTWSIYNSFHLIDFQRFLIDNEIIDKNNIMFSTAFGEYNEIKLLPNNLRPKLRIKILEHISYLENFQLSELINSWKTALLLLDKTDTSFLLTKFLDHVNELDNFRNENFFEIFPELATLKYND
jgi:MoaA/NifB/PqqE/SkfB family radical SAM enzyme